ncbi:antibiotic biosynthesis monooxygenase family protein [Pseudomonadota bacterium]
MYCVIFKAKTKSIDKPYQETAHRMRELALSKYGCTDFSSMMKNDSEIALSYWNSLEDISNWKRDAEHLEAQRLGAEKWYASYTVQICKIEKAYSNP